MLFVQMVAQQFLCKHEYVARFDRQGVPYVTTHQSSLFSLQHQLAGRAMCATARDYCKREFSLSNKE